MEIASIAKYIDHTFLKPDGPRDAIHVLCAEAVAAGFASVCVNPAEVPLAARLLAGTPVKVCTVVDFPLGQSTAAVKCAEALDAVVNGADEIDAVVNRRLLKYDVAACRANLAPLAERVRAARKDAVLKLILECCELSRGEIVAGCNLAAELGFDFVKTSTGFGSGGARVEDVALMSETCGPGMGVKAAGGIRTREDALAMLNAGATRIGTSRGMDML